MYNLQEYPNLQTIGYTSDEMTCLRRFYTNDVFIQHVYEGRRMMFLSNSSLGTPLPCMVMNRVLIPDKMYKYMSKAMDSILLETVSRKFRTQPSNGRLHTSDFQAVYQSKDSRAKNLFDNYESSSVFALNISVKTLAFCKTSFTV